MSTVTVEAPRAYNLTELVGKKSDQGRTMIVATFEVQKRYLAIFLAAFIPALLVGLVAGKLIGVYGVLVFAAVEGAAFYLVEGRTREGLQVRTYEWLNDKRNADTGRVFMCQREVDPAALEFFQVRGGTVPMSGGIDTSGLSANTVAAILEKQGAGPAPVVVADVTGGEVTGDAGGVADGVSPADGKSGKGRKAEKAGRAGKKAEPVVTSPAKKPLFGRSAGKVDMAGSVTDALEESLL